MNYPVSIEQKLSFDRIRELLTELCVSNLGRNFVAKMRFTEKYDQVVKMVNQTAEMKEILAFDSPFPAQNYFDVNNHLTKLSIEGSFLIEEEFFEIMLSIKTIQDCIEYLQKREANQYPNLLELCGLATESESSIAKEKPNEKFNIKHIFHSISRIVDERGKLKDNASDDLQRIRKAIISLENELRKKLDSILRHARNSGWITDDFSLTVRNGRMVIPIAAEHKRKIKGFVHDESDTGKTVFLEPAEILELNNEIKELESAERREIIKILTELSVQIRPFVPPLRKCYTFLGIIDFIRAKANLAIEMGAVLPRMSNKTMLNLDRARHPLLFISYQKLKKKVVPLNLQLPENEHILLVSGPNAGGKSVMLKTIGLIQYMHQSGLLVPVAENTEMGFFKNIFIDIGDEQSLENDLSTYSSHLTNMKFFLENTDAKTLFLIDEFGTGTEPALGGAIAESILEELVKSKAFGVINTHYTNLKAFADKKNGIINGAMQFDSEHLEPLFELETGKPGSSFALEIAHKIGLKKSVIHNAKQKLGFKQVNFEKMLKELDIEKKIFAEKNVQNALTERALKQNLEQYTQLKDLLESQKKTIVNAAKLEAKTLVKEANQKIEKAIKDIREFKADKEITKVIREELEVFEKQELKLEIEKPKIVEKEPEYQSEKGEITVKSLVRIKGQDTVGEVIALRGKDAEVAMGSLKTTIKLNRLEKISRKEFKSLTVEDQPIKSLSGIDLNEKMMNFTFNLDIRGKRGELALQEVDSFLDDAIILGYPELRIVHGKGDGILRTLIRNHLKGYKQVGKMVDEHADRGGAGVTIVTMK
jgi:DNA mismatch repair protein MutS2